MNTKHPKPSRFAHIYGMNGQFVLLEQHSEWMPVNDADYDNAPALPEGFVFADEAFYTTDGSVPPLVLPDNIKIFNEEARIEWRAAQVVTHRVRKSTHYQLSPARARGGEVI